MIICIGGCCVPVHLLLAFLVAAAHRHGYLTWFREDWVKFQWWRNQLRLLLVRGAAAVKGTGSAQAGRTTVTTVAPDASKSRTELDSNTKSSKKE